MAQTFHEKLKSTIDVFVHRVYRVTWQFPKDELYGASSQLRRAALSVALNYIEGYARKRKLVKINFFEISYGSLQESKYLLSFALAEDWLSDADYRGVAALAEELGAMLWKTIEHLHHAA